MTISNTFILSLYYYCLSRYILDVNLLKIKWGKGGENGGKGGFNLPPFLRISHLRSS